MPLPSQVVILLAKSYAYQLAETGSPAAAYAFIENEHPEATRSQLQSAVRQAQRAIRVGDILESLPETSRIRDALEGQRAPAQRVGVRVKVTRHSVFLGGYTEDRENVLYVEVPWDATKQDVLSRVRTWFENTERGSGPAVAWEVEFTGPTLWPGQSNPEYGGL